MKNKILSIVLAVLTVLSVIPFTMLATDASVPAFYSQSSKQGFGYRFEGSWDGSANRSRTVHGYAIETTTLEDEEVYSISVNPADFDEPNSPTGKVYDITSGSDVKNYPAPEGLNLYRYNSDRQAYKDETTGFIPTTTAGEKFYVVVEYKYEKAAEEDLVEGDIGTALDGTKMKWHFYSSTGYYGATTDSTETIVGDDEWHKLSFEFTPDTSGLYLGQMAFLPVYGLGAGRMRIGDVLYIKNYVIVSDNAAGAKPTDEVTVSFYASADDYDDGADPFETKSGTVLTSITAPTYTGDNAADFLYWQNADYDVTLQAGAGYLLNRSETEDFYAVFANSVQVKFDGFDGVSPISGKTGSKITLPTPSNLIASEKKLVGWSLDGTTYALGAEYTIPVNAEGDITFTAVLVDPISITFTGKDDANTTAYPGDTITIPGAPASGDDHDGQTFLGWNDGSKTYKAGATYTVGTTAATFTAKYATPQKVMLSNTAEPTPSVPNDVHLILNGTIGDADAYIADNGGVGTIYVYGKYNIDNTTFKSTDLTIRAYDDAAKGVIEFNAVTASDLHGTNLKLTFDDITLKRADNPGANEQFTGFDGIDVTFGENCKYATGTFGDGTVGIYFGHYANSGTLTFADAKHTINAPFTASQFGVLMGYVGGGRTLTQNVEYVVNGGTFEPNLLVQNGYQGGNSDTIIGNITWTLNGGTFGRVSMGNIATKLNGTLKLTVNGGVFNSGLIFGITGDNRGSAQAADNVIYILNAKKITDGKYTVPEVSTANGNKQSITRGVSILNNAELVDDVSKHIAPNAKYRLAVKNGSADANVDSTGALKFTFTPDNTFEDGYDVYVGSEKVTAVNGVYTLSASTDLRTVQFVEKGIALYTLNYKNGDTTVKSEQVLSGMTITLKNVGITAPTGKALKGYTDGTTEYELGATYTVPTGLDSDTLTLTAVFEEFDGKTYYVTEGGSDQNDGHRKETAYAFETILKAIEAIGTGTGEIVVNGDTKWGTASTGGRWDETEVVTVNGNVTITFEDGATVARTSPDSSIKYAGTGSLKLVNIAEIYKVDGTTNTNHPHKIVPALPNLTVEGDYKVKFSGGYWASSNFYPTSFPADNKITLNLNGKIGIFEFFDWGTTNVNGTIYLNVGNDFEPDAFYIGGDNGGGTVGTTITGPLYITATDNTKNISVRRGGNNAAGPDPTITINGLQILNIRSNIDVCDAANKGTFTNNGGEYIINVPILYEGLKVESTELGKIKITLKSGFTATVTNGTNVQNITETGVVTLVDGTSTVAFSAGEDAKIPVTIDGSDYSQKALPGDKFTVPTFGKVGDLTVIGVNYNGAFYVCGGTINVPADATSLALTTVKVDMRTPVIYVDQTNGADSNVGFTSDHPVKTFAQVTKLINTLDTSVVVTVKVVGEYTDNNVNLPTYGGKIVIDGNSAAKLSYGESLQIHSDVEFKNIAFNSTVSSKHIDCYGYNVTFGSGIVTAGSQQGINVHAGFGGRNYTGNEKIVINSGDFARVFLGIYYLSCTAEEKNNFDSPKATWTGDIALEVNGGSVAGVTFGDGYEWPAGNYVHGTFKVDGNVSITVKDGNVGMINRGYLASATSIKIITYPILGEVDEAFANKMNATVQCYNGVTVDNDGKLTEEVYNIDTKLNYNVGDTLPTDQSFVLSKGQFVGKYDDDETEFEDKSFLPVIGAQLRLTGTDHALRFITQVSLDKLEKYNQSKDTQDYGFIVIPTEVLQGAPLYNGASYIYNGETYEAAKVPAVKKYEVTDTYLQYTVALTGIGSAKADLTREYTVIPYIIKDGVYYYGNSYSCNLYEVAKAAQSDTKTPYTDAQKEKINSIVETVDGPTTAD